MRLLLKSYNALRFLSRRMSSQRNLVAVCQITARNNKQENFDTCKELVERALEHGAKMVFFPEACDFIGESKAETLEMSEPLDGQLMSEYQNLAKKCKIWLSLGGIHEKVSEEKVRNSHVIIDSCGDIIAVYHKTHLFDVEIPEKNIRLKESDYVEAGKSIVPPIESPVGNIGLCICYDVRFAELGTVLRNAGAEILTYPSAFTQSTGASHWEVMLRARAIETQCYVIAAAQTGSHNPKRSSWGHAMIIDPWGTIVAQCSEGTGLALGFIDQALIKRVRTNMPVLTHRRYDLYPDLSSKYCEEMLSKEQRREAYQFGQSIVKADQIFYETCYSIAFTNKRCVLPGHVLVAPKRSAKRLCDLSKEEVADLFLAVTHVQKMVEGFYEANASTVSVQDGKDAGQTVEHVHVHVLPRRPEDFPHNDDIYSSLEKHDKIGEDRIEPEMFKEAQMLKKFNATGML